MATINDLLTAYHELCGFCDDFQKKTGTRYPNDFVCRKGCADCCTLESVSGLEAYVLTDFLRRHKIAGRRDPAATAETGCPLLVDRACLVYPERPLICRTHGLPIRSTVMTGGEVDACPLNFAGSDPRDIEREYVLDVDMITANLVRLNMAFSLLCGRPEMSGDRYLLRDVASGGLTDVFDLLVPPAAPIR